ncbi:general transcription factor IIH subunit 2 [Drosophila takahashii]|uniref:general transcription factor IIH subunit 2 n=1 Tax=Drosophila takahashii TaxID=29030 RepID=UPI001CF87B5D|nr:general transcription factor IIH subunit 2 isoform X1 [Drosophila takahashii]
MADDEQEDQKEYRWETGYEKTWEAIKDDDDGLLDGAIAEIIQKAKRQRQAQKSKQNRLGMMRHLFLVLDCSESMSVPDLKPTRLRCTVKLLELFIEEFFDQNPISQLGIIALKAKRAEKVTELTGTSRVHLKALERWVTVGPFEFRLIPLSFSLANVSLTSEPSLQNGLNLALKTLKVVPSHASREIVIIMGSLTTCDPVDINLTIDELKKEGIRCSVISLSAEIHVARYLTQQTMGTFGAVLDDAHFRDQLMSQVDPPPAAKTQHNSLIRMGFPHTKNEVEGKDAPLSMCMCHIENLEEPSELCTTGHHCPQCNSKYCELPVECQSCGLTLVSAPHLARSYHHLFPVPNFEELPFEAMPATSSDLGSGVRECYACAKALGQVTEKVADKVVFKCGFCKQFFCIDCDIFIHETLHACVGCNTIPGVDGLVYQQKTKADQDESHPGTSKQRAQFGM